MRVAFTVMCFCELLPQLLLTRIRSALATAAFNLRVLWTIALAIESTRQVDLLGNECPCTGVCKWGERMHVFYPLKGISQTLVEYTSSHRDGLLITSSEVVRSGE